ncbi:MAG: S8 family serine peptidase [Nitriliruptor sp.]
MERPKVWLVGALVGALTIGVGPVALAGTGATTSAAGQVRSASAAASVAASAMGDLDVAVADAAVAAVGDRLADRLLVTFHDGVAPADAQSVLDAAGVEGEVASGYAVAVADVTGEVTEAIGALAASALVAHVELDELLDFGATTRQPPAAEDAASQEDPAARAADEVALAEDPVSTPDPEEGPVPAPDEDPVPAPDEDPVPAPDEDPVPAPDPDDPEAPAHDPLRELQWWWNNSGQVATGSSGASETGLHGIDIGAHESWSVTKGRSTVVVAIIDTGFDTNHPDLRDNLWVNPSVGSYGCPGDLHGCAFSVDGPSGQVYADEAADRHGTHVAGIVAATEDAVGIVGVAPRVKLMSVKFLEGSEGRLSDGVRAIQYATRAGADVINASWGVPGSAAERPELDRALRDAEVPVVTAAGNTGRELRETPVEQRSMVMPAVSPAPNVIVVTAVDNRGAVPRFASWSTRYVDVAAPGVEVLSTFPEGRYGTLDGTSQAAPAVSGIVALAISATGVTDGARLAEAVRAGARPLGHLADPYSPSGASIAGLASGPGTLRALGADLGACPGGAPTPDFTDLRASDVHTPNVACIVHRGIASGYADGTYRPDLAVTRGQVAAYLAQLVRTARSLPIPSEATFTDLDQVVHRDDIEALADMGIIGGFSDDTFRADLPVTRAQFASLLVRTYERLAGGSIRATGRAFPDVAGSTHERNVGAAVQAGFVRGKSADRFDPGAEISRGQLGSMLRGALDKLVNDRVSTLP